MGFLSRTNLFCLLFCLLLFCLSFCLLLFCLFFGSGTHGKKFVICSFDIPRPLKIALKMCSNFLDIVLIAHYAIYLF